MGQSPPSSTFNKHENGLPFFRGKSDFGIIHPTIKNWCSEPKKIAEKNDILISICASVGSTNISLEKCCIGRGLAAIRILNGIDLMFIFYQLRAIENSINALGTGTTINIITDDKLQSILLNIPPTNEQKRIVTKIKSIFTQIDTIETNLKNIQKALKQCKQATLSKAFEGKLVPQNPNDESAEILLKKIHGYNLNINHNKNLPRGWIKTNLEQICTITLGQSPPSSTYNKQKNGLPFFQGKTDFGNMYPTARNWCSKPNKLAGKNDILISVRAPVGSTNISLEKCCIGRGLAAIRVSKGIDFMFIFYKLQTIKNNIKSLGIGTTFSAIKGDQLKSIIVDIPPNKEQKRIVSKIESIFNRIDTIDEYVENILLKTNILKKSVLQHAFEGKLVPQDPNDESAHILLEKIKKQNIKVQTKPKKRTRNGR